MQLYVETRYDKVLSLDELEEHGLDSACREPCMICAHDPCMAEVRLGGFDSDIGNTGWARRPFEPVSCR